jgi:hypothetical protein
MKEQQMPAFIKLSTLRTDGWPFAGLCTLFCNTHSCSPIPPSLLQAHSSIKWPINNHSNLLNLSQWFANVFHLLNFTLGHEHCVMSSMLSYIPEELFRTKISLRPDLLKSEYGAAPGL